MSAAEESPSARGHRLDLQRSGRFLIFGGACDDAPRTIQFGGRRWFRFMDRIYLPEPAHRLSPDEVRELCELRLPVPSG